MQIEIESLHILPILTKIILVSVEATQFKENHPRLTRIIQFQKE